MAGENEMLKDLADKMLDVLGEQEAAEGVQAFVTLSYPHRSAGVAMRGWDELESHADVSLFFTGMLQAMEGRKVIIVPVDPDQSLPVATDEGTWHPSDCMCPPCEQLR